MVKCVDCGFLAAWNTRERRFEETDRHYREHGDFYGPYEATQHLQRAPVCFVRAFDLREEAVAWADQPPERSESTLASPSTSHIRTVINEDRTSQLFFDWRQGSSPREHREMSGRQWLMEAEERRDREMREREDRRDLEMREREDRRDDDASRRHWRELIIFGGIVTLVVVASALVSAILGGLVERGDLF